MAKETEKLGDKYERTRGAIERENRELRNLLRVMVDIDPATFGPEEARKLQDTARAMLEGMDARLNGPGFNHPGVREKAVAGAQARQRAFLDRHGPLLRELKGAGHSFRGMAAQLNERRIPAPAGGAWKPGSVKLQWDKLVEIEAAG